MMTQHHDIFGTTIPTQQSHGFTPKTLECGELDDYLSALLLPQFLQTFKYIPFSIPKSEIKKILSFVTFALSVRSVENTPACKALGLQLNITRRSPTNALLVYAILKLLMPHVGRWLRDKCDQYRTSSTPDMEGSASSSEALAEIRQHKVLQRCFRVLDTTIPMLRLLLVLECWSRIRTHSSFIPDLEKWLAGFQYAGISSPTKSVTTKGEAIHVLFAHRRWVQRWLQACVPILALPLLRSARESRDLLASWNEELQRCFVFPLRKLLSRAGTESSCKRCPVCRTETIIIPVETNCGHVYCYTCLWTYLRGQQDDRPQCKICGKNVTSCYPLRIT